MVEVNRSGEQIKTLIYLHGEEGSLLECHGIAALAGETVKLSTS